MKPLLLIAALTLPLGNARAEEPVLDGGVDASVLNEIPDHPQKSETGYQFNPSDSLGVVGSEAEANRGLTRLSWSKDCGKSAALKSAQTAVKRINVFRTLVERDKKNLEAVQRVYGSHPHKADSSGLKSEAEAIPLMTKTLDDLQYDLTTGRFETLKVACTKGTESSLRELNTFIATKDKAIMNGGNVYYLQSNTLSSLLEASGKVVPNKTLEAPAGHLGFIRGVWLSSVRDDAGGCNFDVPFDELAVSKVLQEKTHDGKKLAFACSEKFKGVEAVDKGDTVEIQINKSHSRILDGEFYPDSRKIMDKVMEVTDGPGSKYMWNDYGSTEGLKAPFFR